MNLEESAREVHHAGISIKDAAALIQWDIDNGKPASNKDLEAIATAIDDIESSLSSLREALAKISE